MFLCYCSVCFTFLNTTVLPIAWLSKKVATIRTVVFGAEVFGHGDWSGSIERIVLQVVNNGCMFGWTTKDLIVKITPSGLI